MFTNEFHYYSMDMVANVCSIQCLGVLNRFDHMGIWHQSQKVMTVGKGVYSIQHGCLRMSAVLLGLFSIIIYWIWITFHEA